MTDEDLLSRPEKAVDCGPGAAQRSVYRWHENYGAFEGARSGMASFRVM
jgi:hypothetical protein